MTENKAYRKAGVDLESGYEVVRRIKNLARTTYRPEVLGDIGAFGGLFAFPGGRYREPVLVSGADGVGTKLKIAFEMGIHDTVGIDAVAMCVNDVAAMGAEPLFFLDYLATGKIQPQVAEEVIKGVAEGCRQAGCALIGGETAEMPGFYAEGEYDLAGFAVGVAEKTRLCTPEAVSPGDVLIGLASSGLHSNGFSLTRRIVADRGFSYGQRVEGWEKNLGEEFLTPTRIYVRALLAVAQGVRLKGAAHITGGGFYENIPRILPEGSMAVVHRGSWNIPPVFDWLQREGTLGDQEMYNTYNMGLGMIVAVDRGDVDQTLAILREHGEQASVVGEVTVGGQGVEIR